MGVSPWKEGDKRRTLEGGEVWWENRGGGRVLMPGDVDVVRVNGGTANGELWILRGVVNYDE